MILLAQQNGAGPIVSLSLGLGSAPAALSAAPTVTSAMATDLVLITRQGALNLLPVDVLASEPLPIAIEIGATAVSGSPLFPMQPTDMVLFGRAGVATAITWAQLITQIKQWVPSTDYRYPFNSARRFLLGTGV